MAASSERSAAHRTRTTRGRSAPERLRKTGWQVRQSVADAVRLAVENGAAQSQNAFVERAVIRELRELRRERVYRAYAEAASDVAFIDEMEELTSSLDHTAGDGLSRQG